MSLARVVILALLLFGPGDAAATTTYVMPRELVEHANKLGCSQIDDFFDVNGMIGPPYTYGYIPGRPEDSAVFWCEKHMSNEHQYFLAVMVHPSKSTGPLTCPSLIKWHNRPGGLDIYRDPLESLAEFVYLDAPEKRGPNGRTVMHHAIRSSKPGQSTTFYCHEGRWLIRSRH
jgi:hypothetical protein